MNQPDKLMRSYAELIILSGPELFAYIYNKHGEELVNWIMSYIANEDSSFHTSYITGDLKNDSVRGIILTIPVTVLKQKSKSEVKLIRQNTTGSFGFAVYLLKIMWRMRLTLHYPKLNDDEVFVSNLAVYDDNRRQGIGGRLLTAAEEKAKAEGYGRMSLFVELNNDKAMRLYQKHGYEIVSKKVFPKTYQKYHLYGLYKMAKNVCT
jgi:ribosomal protein S18 acetylase RimI-like enzyme